MLQALQAWKIILGKKYKFTQSRENVTLGKFNLGSYKYLG